MATPGRGVTSQRRHRVRLGQQPRRRHHRKVQRQVTVTCAAKYTSTPADDSWNCWNKSDIYDLKTVHHYNLVTLLTAGATKRTIIEKELILYKRVSESYEQNMFSCIYRFGILCAVLKSSSDRRSRPVIVELRK